MTHYLKPRIALVTHDYGTSGGVNTMTRFLYQALSDTQRFEPEIVSLALSSRDLASVRLTAPRSWNVGPQVFKLSREGIPYLHVGAWFSEFEFQRYRPRKILTALLNRYDAIQVVAGTPPWMWAVSKANRPKYLWTATTTRTDRNTRLQQARPLRRFWLSAMTQIAERYERQGLHIASEVFALSDYTLRNIDQIRGREMARLATCGVDTDFFRPASAVPKKNILCVGRLDDPRKNTSLLVQAYARLRKRFSDAPELWLVGPEPAADVMRLIRQDGLADFVRVLGPQQPAALVSLYQGALCLALSSDEEGLGIVLLEAMACGIPVVSTACGGPQTAVEHGRTGFLTPLRDADALADAFGRLVADSGLRQRMGAEARKVCLDRFALSSASKVFTQIYERDLGDKSASRNALEATVA